MITKSPRSILPFVCAAGIVSAMLFGGAVSTVFAAASLTPLGDLPGGDFVSVATGISADGTVIVGYGTSASGFEGFIWTDGGGMVGLGVLPGGTGGFAGDANSDGSVIVGAGDSDSGYQAFRWTSSGGMIGLGTLPGEYQSFAGAVSADGSSVVGHSQRSAGVSNYYEAFRWTSGGGMVGLGDLPGSLFASSANGVSADGSVVVGGGYSASGLEAFRWTAGDGMIGLGDLPGGSFGSAATAVSANGLVTVGYSTSASGFEAFLWTSGGGMVGLGDVPGGSFSSYATAVSDDGSVVVGYGNLFFGSSEAFRWTSDRGMERLWDVLLAEGVDPAADGWTSLQSANDISADGSTIVGHGIRNNNSEAFVAVIPTIVPEPAAGALALLGASSILLVRRRSLGRPNKFRWAPGGFRPRRQIMRSNVCAFLAILLCTSAAARAFAAASLTPLGYLPGGDGSGAKGVSADGSVVVGYSSSDSGHGREAFRWTSAGGMVGLGDLPGGKFKSEAYGVSADGSVIVGWGTVSDSLSREAFRWTSDGGMVSLGYLPGGGDDSEANGVSADGSVIVGQSDRGLGNGWEAFRWTSGGGMAGLGDLLPPGDDLNGSESFGVSADGSVIVGNSLSHSGSSGIEAFRWTSGGGMVGLGHLFSGETGEANGVSADGSVIVGYSFSSDYEAFRWTSDGGMERLWDVLLAKGVDPAADGWTRLLLADGISADGNTIVGSGQRNGAIEAFVAVIPTIVPEPAGDFDHDGDVDRDDLLKWQGDFGQNGSSDADNDGDSDGADFLAWQRQLGGEAFVASNSQLAPEPPGGGLLVVALAAILRRPTRRWSRTDAMNIAGCERRLPHDQLQSIGAA